MKGIYVITIAFLASWTEITAKENQPERSIWKVGFYEEKIPWKCPFPEKDPYTTTNLPHESDCTKFYKCFLGKGVLQDCPLMTAGDPVTRLHYNRSVQVCDWPWQAGCVHCPEKGESKISHETDNCTRYYECKEGKKSKEPKDCPAGTCFSRTCQDVEPCVKDRAGGNCEPIPRCRVGDKTHHECSCFLYYECNENGDKIPKFCDGGRHFDSRTQRCTAANESDCTYPYDLLCFRIAKLGMLYFRPKN